MRVATIPRWLAQVGARNDPPHARAWRLGASLCLAASLFGCDLDSSASGAPTSAIEPANDADAATPDVDSAAVGANEDASTVVVVPPSMLDAGKPNGTTIPPGSCDLTGLFAVKIEAQVEWSGSTLFDIVPIITPGKGKLSVVVIAEMTESGGVRTSNVRACGATTPDFSSSISETYGVAFPDDVWEKLALRWSAAMQVECLQPGCEIDTAPVVAQLGIGIPTSTTWPTSRDPIDVASLRDDDGDGVPGIMLRCRGARDPGDSKYTHPPTSPLLTQRVSEINMAIRLAAQLSGKLDDCNRYSGQVPDMTIDTRALACETDLGTRCTADAVGFIDDNLPVWKVNGAKFKAVRLPPGAGCSDARSAMP